MQPKVLASPNNPDREVLNTFGQVKGLIASGFMSAREGPIIVSSESIKENAEEMRRAQEALNRMKNPRCAVLIIVVLIFLLVLIIVMIQTKMFTA